MKRFAKVFVAMMMIVSLLMSSALAEVIDMMPLIKLQQGGIVETVDEWLRIASHTDNGDQYLLTNHVLGKAVNDYVWSFTYKPMITEWNQDKFVFRSVNESNEWDCYVLRVMGNQCADPTLTLYKGDDQSVIFGSADQRLEWNAAYDVRIEVEGTHVAVYFAKEGTLTADSAPAIEVDLPNSGADYSSTIIDAGDFQIASWAGNFYIKDMKLTIGEETTITPTVDTKTWYSHNTACAYGLHFRDETQGLTDKWYTYVPIDLSVDGRHEFEYVASNMYIIGKVYVDVNGDDVLVSYENFCDGYGYTTTESEFFTFFPDLESVTCVDPEQLTGFEFGKKLSIQNDLNGDTSVLLFVRNVVTYCDHVTEYKKLTRLYDAERQAILDKMYYVQNFTGNMGAISGESGLVQTLTDGVRLAGRKADLSGDDYLNTWHILGEKVSDFVWTFNYTPNRVDWNQDRFFFRSEDENEWNGYCLYVGGNENADNIAGLHLYKGEAYDAPIAAMDYELEEGKTYTVKIAAEGKNVKVWFAPVGEMNEDTAPVFDVQLPDTDEDYASKYIDAGDFQIISWAGDFVITNMNVEINR